MRLRAALMKVRSIGFALFVGAVGIALLWIYLRLEKEAHIGHALIHEIGFACAISCLIYFLIESRIHKQRERVTQAQMLHWVFGEMVDTAAWNELTEQLTRGAVCESWSLTLDIEACPVPSSAASDSGSKSCNRFVSRGVHEYRLRNYHHKELWVEVSHELLAAGPTHPDQVELPRFTELKYVVKKDKEEREKDAYDENRLKNENVWTGDRLEKKILLPIGATVCVTLQREEIFEVPLEFPWYLGPYTTKSPQLDVRLPRGGGLTCEVLLRHHSGVESGTRSRDPWALPRVYFPGQGFSLMLKPTLTA